MPYYHVQIRHITPNGLGEFHPTTEHELDLSEEETRMICEQYAADRVFFKGKWIDTSTIEEIEIRQTPEKTTYFFPTITYSRIFQSSDFPNVTRRFIKSPSKGRTTSTKSERTTQPLSKDIFIVHGRDHAPMKELKVMLYEFGLNPIVLREQPSGSRTIVEKLEKYSDVGYVFIILTPDDASISWNSFLDIVIHYMKKVEKIVAEKRRATDITSSEEMEETFRKSTQKRARQNVILEFGYFMGLLGRNRVCCLHKGRVELPSDMDGIVYIPFESSVEEIRLKIMKELKEAGYEIKL